MDALHRPGRKKTWQFVIAYRNMKREQLRETAGKVQAAADAGAMTADQAMSALYAKMAGGGRGGSAALRSFLDALE
jgi:hypothetical protein